MNKIAVIDLRKKDSLSAGKLEKRIKNTARKFISFLKKENCYVEIFLISAARMKLLNKKFRGKNKTTNILTFVEPQNFPHPELGLKYLGQIYLNPSAIPLKDFNLMIAHGLLHLFGFQHKSENDRIRMEAKERFLVSKV